MKRIEKWILAGVLAAGLFGCRGGSTEKEESRQVFGDAETVPVNVSETGRTYSNSEDIQPGRWKETGEVHFEPVTENGKAGFTVIQAANTEREMYLAVKDKNGQVTEYTITMSNPKKEYRAGEKVDFSLYIVRDTKNLKKPSNLYGSLYFADVKEGSDIFGQEVTVREYMRKRPRTLDRPVYLDHFGTGMYEGRDGAADLEHGEQSTYHPACYFPRMVKEGDTITIVLDIVEEDAGVRMRTCREYAWVSGETEKQEIVEEETDHSGYDWIRNDYSGRWDLTDIRYVTMNAEPEAGVIPAAAERRGVDGQMIRFAFAGEKEPLIVEIPEESYESVYYPGDPFFAEETFFCSSAEEPEKARINSTLALGRVTYEGTGISDFEVYSCFTKGYPPREVESFGPFPHDETMSWRDDLLRGYLMLETAFPEGTKDGEKLCIVFAAADGDETSMMLNIYEYTWTGEEQVVWTYNPPMY